MAMDDDFVWCPERWDGPGGSYDLGNEVVRNHICAVTKPGHTRHVCCCLAVKEE